jgi:hypothetical protein
MLVYCLLLQPSAQILAATPDVATLKEQGYAIVDAYTDRMGRLGDAIYSYSELAGKASNAPPASFREILLELGMVRQLR